MQKFLTKRQSLLLQILRVNEWILTHDLISQLSPKEKVSQITVTRELRSLIETGFVQRTGKGKATAYKLSSLARVMMPIDIDDYFKREIDERDIIERYNAEITDTLKTIDIFSGNEKQRLSRLLREYHEQVKMLSPIVLKKEWERVTIEFSWKSSAIEGNTYSLLETENLLKEGIKAHGKTPEEAIMLLNHKAALQFIRENIIEFQTLNIAIIEHVHRLLVKDLGVSANLRKTLVGITGTRYKPLDNEFQIKEALDNICKFINNLKGIFEKSMLAILLLSYLQPFEDGNKRTARLLGNALLLVNDGFPLSFRSVEINLYKRVMLLFYETNNLFLFKQIFLEQAEFAVKNYFRSKIG